MVVWFVSLAALGIRGILKVAGSAVVARPAARAGIPGSQRVDGFRRFGRRVPGRHRRGGPVCGRGALWRPADSHCLVWAGAAGVVLELPWPGALVLQDPKSVENPFYLLAPHWALYLTGGAGDGGNGHRLPGADLRSVFIDHSSDPTRLSPAHGRQAHLLDGARPDLPAAC